MSTNIPTEIIVSANNNWHKTKRILKMLPLIFSFCILTLFIAFALFPELFAPYSPDAYDIKNRLLGFSSDHLLGTDNRGRDVLSRLIYGARASLGSVVLIAIFIVITGFITGAISGLAGGWVDTVIMRVCELFMTFQTFILALFLIAILGRGLTNVIIAIVLTHWAWYSRLVRSMIMKLKSKDYILAAKVCGGSNLSIFFKHFFLPILSQIIILATLDLGHMMLHVSGLSFLGLGVQPPTPEWGVMINDARTYIWTDPSLVIIPGLMILLTVLACNIPSEWLRDKLDPTLSSDRRGENG